YYNGKTENWLGRALRGRRDKVFLMTKVCTHGRSGQLALQMLEESLRRLRTDHLDLWQIHGIVYDNDPQLAYAAEGVLEAFDQAQKRGKTRFVGCAGHKDPAYQPTVLDLGDPCATTRVRSTRFDATTPGGRTHESCTVSLRYDNPVTRLPHGFPIDPTQREVKAMLEKGTGTWEAK